MDVWPGMDIKSAHASATAYSKPSLATIRYAIDVVIPDLNQPDAVAEVASVKDVTDRAQQRNKEQ